MEMTNGNNNNSNATNNKNQVTIGTIVGGIIMAIVIYFIVTAIFGGGSGSSSSKASGQNIKVAYVTDYSVGFNSICPYCKHVNSTKSVELSKGEEFEGIAICNSCGKAYDITVKRKK